MLDEDIENTSSIFLEGIKFDPNMRCLEEVTSTNSFVKRLMLRLEEK